MPVPGTGKNIEIFSRFVVACLFKGDAKVHIREYTDTDYHCSINLLKAFQKVNMFIETQKSWDTINIERNFALLKLS